MHSLLLFIAEYSYWGIFLALALGILGLPIPDETLMAFAGFLAYQGRLYYPFTLIVAFVGTSCGITIGYFLGKAYGHPFLEKYSARMHIKRKLHKAEKWYGRYGKFALFIGYFIPGVRHFTAIFAGISLMPYRIFAVFAYVGGLLWTLTFVSLGYFLGKNWQLVLIYSNRYIIPFAVAIILVLLLNLLKTLKRAN
jgi:membrane protein DedA with SNARE-associated domain